MILPPGQVLEWYCNGIFPMAEHREGDIYLFNPERRGIFPLDGLKISNSLGKTIRSGKFEPRFNTAFPEVLRACADRDETWISDDISDTYIHLHEIGYAHSVEAWHSGTLAGGLYGVSIGGAFFGESMFHNISDASKVALYYLVERMRERRMSLLDTQYITPHLERLGAIEIPRTEYLIRLRKAIEQRVSFFP